MASKKASTTLKKLGMIMLSFGCVMAVLLAAGGYLLNKQLIKEKTLETPRLFLIERGQSIKQISLNLAEAKLITYPFYFEMEARFFNQDTPLQAGEYQISSPYSIRGLVDLFQSGKTHQRSLTIPEGLTIKQIEPLINGAEALQGDIETLPQEGRLLPQTYFYSYGDTRQSLIDRMAREKKALLDQLWEKRAEGLPLETKEEALILASIVERETGQSDERAKVAGVFINRLKRGMKLQSDPTIIYPLSDRLGVLDRALYRSDWALDDAYNTYQNAGLPPGPIANPGEASLRAVLNPAEHDYLYFVADGTGGHAFAKTLEGHNRNVANWRKIKKERGLE